MFYYHFFGLNIASEFELPEASGTAAEPTDNGNPDVIIRQGKVPPEIADFVAMADTYEVGQHTILLTVPGVARFLMDAGKSITVELSKNAETQVVRTYLLGMALGAILHQRGLLVLHGSAIDYHGSCIGFLGQSGAGKSTMATLLSSHGHLILSDDVLVIRPGVDGRPQVSPGLPTLKMWPDIADQLMASKAPAFQKPSLTKRRIHIPSAFATKPVPLRALYVLRWLLPQSAAAEIDAVNIFDGVAELRKNSFRGELISPLGLDRAFMSNATWVAQNIEFFRLKRPMRPDSTIEFYV